MHESPHRQLFAVLAVAGLWGCGSAQTHHADDSDYAHLVSSGAREPTSDLERAILAALPKLQTGSARTIQGSAVVVSEPYYAASGRTCRGVTIQQGDVPPDHELVCRIDNVWSFVPEALPDWEPPR